MFISVGTKVHALIFLKIQAILHEKLLCFARKDFTSCRIQPFIQIHSKS